MKTLILYYTLGGTSRKKAEEIAANTADAVLCEVKERKNRNIISAFIPGCPQAMHRTASNIQPMEQDMKDFDKIVIVCPIWAGHPAPAFNTIVAQLTAGKEVELYLCSGGGDSSKSKEGTIQMITDKGCTVTGYHDVTPAK